MDRWELEATNMLDHGGSEIVNIFPLIADSQREAWESYAATKYERWVRLGHLERHGSFERLNATGYNYHISAIQPDGSFAPFPNHTTDLLVPIWQFTPAPTSYSIVNWNFAQVPDYGT